MQEKCLDWFPRLRAISLAVEDVEGEQNEYRTLHSQLEATQVSTRISVTLFRMG